MTICAMFGCRSRSKTSAKPTHRESGTGMFCLPKVITKQCERTRALSERRRSVWLARINRKDLKNLDNIRICGRHFITGKPSQLMDETNPDWAPTLHLGYLSESGVASTLSARYARRKERATKKAAATAVSVTSCEVSGDGEPSTDCDMCSEPERHSSPEVASLESVSRTVFAEAVVQTDLCMDHMKSVSPENCVVSEAETQTDTSMQFLDVLHQDSQRLASELQAVKNKKLELGEDALRADEGKVSFYTGLPNFLVLNAVYELVEPAVRHTSQNGLEKFEEFLVFLMKLKFNFPLQDLAYRFHVSCSTVSRIFDKWLHAAYLTMKPLIVWPSRNEIRQTMPQAFFDSFGDKVAVVIDCFEVKLERPSSMLPRCETWSQYKGSNTAKYLIGVCPQGVVSFVSEGWGGRTSDKHLTEHCGILDHLTQGDVVLADRGFDIADTLGLYCARLHIPAFTKGKKQLTALEVETTRRLANVRIHVERVIGLVRNKYTVLKSVIPIDFVVKKHDQVTPLDKIVAVCCALASLCPSVVPENQGTSAS